jgi:hypothetical protein
MDKRINIVYYLWINENRNWKVIINGQLNDLIESNIFSNAKLHIVLSGKTNELLTEVTYYILSILNYVDNLLFDLTTTLKNNYEYFGIKKLYDLANEEPNKIYIYLHSKGMFNVHNQNHKRFHHEEILTKTIVNKWNDIINIFDNNEFIVKAGLFPSTGGWVWFNFFWAKGDYIRTCEIPKLTNNRYYYESWICNSILNEFNTYCIYNNTTDTFSGDNALKLIETLHGVF